ncbi:hypothetical protein CD790_14760 [Streptomyces sp. SAJ15]|nr:hypothetical protein CD790_14760 [Streptomyces sp. SAJ15]
MLKISEEIEIILNGVDQAMTRHNEEHPTGQLPADGRSQISTALTAIRAVRTILNSAHDELEKLRLNDTLYPEGRKRMMTELLDDAEEKINQKVSTADANATIARASFVVGAMPQMSKGRDLIAREDARLILDASKDPISMITHLAQRQDDVGALVVTQWGADYLRARGHDDHELKNAQAAIIGMALNGAQQGGDSGRAAAARGALAADSVAGLAGATGQAARSVLSSMRDHYGAPRQRSPKPRDPRRPAAPTVLGEEITLGPVVPRY